MAPWRGPQTVVVGDRTLSAEKILLATGTWPAMPDIPGVDLAINSNELFDLPRFPDRLLIVGGGYIATEFASTFAGLGADVVQSYRGDLFLRGFDHDVRGFLAEEMRKAGVDLRFNHDTHSLEAAESGAITAHLSDGRLDFDNRAVRDRTQATQYCASGPRTHRRSKLNDSGYLCVNEQFQTDEALYFLHWVT